MSRSGDPIAHCSRDRAPFERTYEHSPMADEGPLIFSNGIRFYIRYHRHPVDSSQEAKADQSLEAKPAERIIKQGGVDLLLSHGRLSLL